ncbi:MFS transporter [Kutzneria viridogrisea]|uniref:MFS family permease n=1 Tax=Kutzneria viridogrisea TaxID=47990 RepID=A0ABR6B7N1_9PSEU|nr:MFS family permease [Kutzneria viridogrisea]
MIDLAARPTVRGGALLTAMSVTVLAYSLTQTMLVPTTTVLQHALNTTATWAAWAVLSAPLLASAVLTPLIGKLGDFHGKRRVLLWVLAVFLLGTLGGLVAWDIGSLIAFRAVQGVSLGVLPLVFGIVKESLPADRVTHGLALTSGLVGGAAGLGLVLGGLLVDLLSWRWLFAVSAVLVTAALVLVARSVPESPHRPGGRLDVPGAVLLALGIGGLLLALTLGPTLGWGSAWVLGLFALAVLGLAAFLVVERRSTSPLVDPEVLVDRPVLWIHLAALSLGAAQFVLYVLVPKIAQTGFGTGVTVAGLIMLPGTLVMLPASWLAVRLGERTSLAAGLGCVAAAAGLLALWNGQVWHLVVFYLVASVGFGLVMAVLPRLVTGSVPHDRVATANGVNTVARTAGGAVGSQLAAAILVSGGGYPFAFGAAALVALAGVLLSSGATREGLADQ